MELNDQCIEQPTFLCLMTVSGALRIASLLFLRVLVMRELFAPGICIARSPACGERLHNYFRRDRYDEQADPHTAAPATPTAPIASTARPWRCTGSL